MILKNSILRHLIIITGFIVISIFYFSPILQGKTIIGPDTQQGALMEHEQNTYAKKYGDFPDWSNSAFLGMPVLFSKNNWNIFYNVTSLITRLLPSPSYILFLYLISFYILGIVIGLRKSIAFLGALAFGFSTYLIIIIGAGHDAKSWAIAFFPLMVAGLVCLNKNQFISGFCLLTYGFATSIARIHYQMGYYFLICIGIGIVVLACFDYKDLAFDAWKKKWLKITSLVAISVCLSLGTALYLIYPTNEYVKHSIRGESQLTINPNGTKKLNTKGLSTDYITQYSISPLESISLFIPGIVGRSHDENLNTDSQTYKFFKKMGYPSYKAKQIVQNISTYWGEQPIVMAPMYIGACIIFLLILSLFLTKTPIDYWLISASIISFLFSLGKYFPLLTNLLIKYLPFYNKFRAVSSIQVILQLCVPLLGVLGLQKFLSEKVSLSIKKNALKKNSFYLYGHNRNCPFYWKF